MEFKRVGRKAKAKWRLSRAVGLIILLIPFAFVLVSYLAGNAELLTLIILGAVCLAQLVNLIVYPIIEYAQWEYLITDDRIEIKKGIFWKSHTVLPISRIQHVCARQGPVQRIFGLGTIEIMTAANMHRIEELDFETAEEICALLQDYLNKKLAKLEKKAQVSGNA